MPTCSFQSPETYYHFDYHDSPVVTAFPPTCDTRGRGAGRGVLPVGEAAEQFVRQRGA